MAQSVGFGTIRIRPGNKGAPVAAMSVDKDELVSANIGQAFCVAGLDECLDKVAIGHKLACIQNCKDGLYSFHGCGLIHVNLCLLDFVDFAGEAHG